jgi:hypothetical protein
VTVAIRGATDTATKTGDAGQFDFQNLPDGTYDLSASLIGLAPARRTVTLRPGQSVVVSLTLCLLFIEQTFVTASKAGETDIQSTPIAVTAIKGADLARMQDRTVEHLANRVPSVSFSLVVVLSPPSPA